MKLSLTVVLSIGLSIFIIRCGTNLTDEYVPIPKVKGAVDFYAALPHNVNTIIVEHYTNSGKKIRSQIQPTTFDDTKGKHKFDFIINGPREIPKKEFIARAGVLSIPNHATPVQFHSNIYIDPSGTNRPRGEGVIKIHCVDHMELVSTFETTLDIPDQTASQEIGSGQNVSICQESVTPPSQPPAQ